MSRTKPAIIPEGTEMVWLCAANLVIGDDLLPAIGQEPNLSLILPNRTIFAPLANLCAASDFSTDS